MRGLEGGTVVTDFQAKRLGGLMASRPDHGWSNVVVPDKQSLVTDAGKLFVLDGLLSRLKAGGHRVLIYSQVHTKKYFLSFVKKRNFIIGQKK